MSSSTELLAPLDLAFWHLESPTHPLHLGALAHFGPVPATPDHEPPVDVLDLLARRAAAVPRLRMRVRDVLLPVGGAAWSADPDFDVRHHVREITLPGADFAAETTRLAAELMERPVERGLPPWEMYLLTGAPDGSFAVLVKLHHALADGMRAVAIGAGIFDEIAAGRHRTRRPRPVPPRSWLPGPGRLLDLARDRLGDLGRAVEVGASVVGASVVRAGRLDGRPGSALAAESSGTRRIATATLSLDRVHRIRRTTGGTANDVLLAVAAGALRRWFDGRGLPLPGADPRALVPVSRRRPGAAPGPGNSLSGYLLDLPVTEPDPAARLAAVRHAMDRNKAAGPFRGAGAVALLADQLPPLAHRFGAPFAAGAARLLFDLLVTQVPLPRSALSLGGAPLRALFPMAPLARGQSLAVAMSPYGGSVHIGLVADGEAVPDLDALAAAFTAELDLLDPPDAP